MGRGLLALAAGVGVIVLGAAPAVAHPGPGGLAFMRGHSNAAHNSIWLADAKGRRAHRLGPGWGPLIAPNGRLVAAEIEGKPALVIYSSTGAVRRRLFTSGRWLVWPVAWSPDSRYLVVSVQQYGPARPPAAVALVDVRTGRSTIVALGTLEGAAFAPSGTERFVFGLAKPAGATFAGPNLYEAWIVNHKVLQLTHDGRSSNPVWGALGIVFDRETPRTHLGQPAAPVYQLVLLHQGRFRQITHMKVFWLLDGLRPIAVSADGTRLAANLVGQDTDEAWSVNLVTGRLYRFPTGLTADGISRDGRRVLLESTFGWLDYPNKSVIETRPFSGGRATVLIKAGGYGSWNS